MAFLHPHSPPTTPSILLPLVPAQATPQGNYVYTKQLPNMCSQSFQSRKEGEPRLLTLNLQTPPHPTHTHILETATDPFSQQSLTYLAPLLLLGPSLYLCLFPPLISLLLLQLRAPHLDPSLDPAAPFPSLRAQTALLEKNCQLCYCS